jgi:hypothetical protein
MDSEDQVKVMADALERPREVRRALLQTTAELARGIKILDAELKHGQFNKARQTLAAMSLMLDMQDQLMKYLPREEHNAN